LPSPEVLRQSMLTAKALVDINAQPRVANAPSKPEVILLARRVFSDMSLSQADSRCDMRSTHDAIRDFIAQTRIDARENSQIEGSL
jgi:hypothetical protein